MNNLLTLIVQYIWYGVLKRTPNVDFSEIPTEINLIPGYDEANDVHYVIAPELPEFIVTGKTSEELHKNIGDSILVYYDVPSYFARKYKDGILNFTNQKTGTHETIKFDKKALDEVFA
jgi:predicted RNase H-like HicB family nuclease